VSVRMERMSALLVISCVCAVLAGLVHVYIFFLESVAWTSPRVRKIFGIASDAEARATRSLAFNQGFYNLFLAIGAVLGVVFVATGNPATGWTLVVFAAASMLAAAVILAGTGRRYLNSAFAQGTLPLITLLFAFLGSMFAN
jgi:putative membrane protein